MNKTFTKPEFIIFILSLIIVAIGIFLGESTGGTGVNVIIGLCIVTALIIFHLNTAKIAGLSKDNPKVKTMKRLNLFSMLIAAFFFGFINWFPISSAPAFRTNTEFSLVLAIIIIVGNTAPKLPFNRNIGLRLPWTIRDEATWKIAHKILGYLTFPNVAAMILASFFVR